LLARVGELRDKCGLEFDSHFKQILKSNIQHWLFQKIENNTRI